MARSRLVPVFPRFSVRVVEVLRVQPRGVFFLGYPLPSRMERIFFGSFLLLRMERASEPMAPSVP